MAFNKTLLKFALAAAGVFGASTAAVALPSCTPSAATDWCHASFNVNNFTASSYNSTANQTAGFSATGAKTGANNSGTGPNNIAYQVDPLGTGNITLTTPKTKTNLLQFTITRAGRFTFHWQISGTASLNSTGYFYKGTTTANGTWTLLGTGITPPGGVDGTYAVNLAVGDVIGWKSVTANNGTNTSILQVDSFTAVPEIDGGVLPLGAMLLVFGLIANKRRNSGLSDDDAGTLSFA